MSRVQTRGGSPLPWDLPDDSCTGTSPAGFRASPPPCTNIFMSHCNVAYGGCVHSGRQTVSAVTHTVPRTHTDSSIIMERQRPQSRGRSRVPTAHPDRGGGSGTDHSRTRVQSASPYAGLWNHELVLRGAPGLRELDDAWWTPGEVANLWAYALDALQALGTRTWPKYGPETLAGHLADVVQALISLQSERGGWTEGRMATQNGHTALILASHNDHLEVVAALKAAGARQ